MPILHPAKKMLLAAGAACALCAAAPSNAVGMLGFYFINQAFDVLGARAFGALRGDAPSAPPTWEASLGAAELINERLPMSTNDGFAIISARAPAPAALEIVVFAPEGSDPTPQELDQTWGPGLAKMFCSDANLWSRWVAIGGSVGVAVKTRDGALARQYGVARSDCAALARR